MPSPRRATSPSKRKTSRKAAVKKTASQARSKSKRAKRTRNGGSAAGSDCIQVRGARQNNLKGLDLDLPLGKLSVITGPSGSGKSSLAFQTLYAEGQRRYVETFSPYTRQFFERMDKPQVDAIHGIPPAIAIEQANQVRTTRSTVGTITEINDYLKLLFPRLCHGFDPETGEEIRPDDPISIHAAALERFGDRPLLVTFSVAVPPDTEPATFFAFLQEQGYIRFQLFGTLYRTDRPEAFDRETLPATVDVVQDRVSPKRRTRFLEAVERALELGRDRLTLFEADSGDHASFTRGWISAVTGTELKPPTPGLFSFNHPLGACAACRGFGRVIGIDLERALPDKTRSLRDGVVRAFQGESYQECQEDLERYAGLRGIDLDTPFEDLSTKDQQWVLLGEFPGDAERAWREHEWYGVRGFFDWLEGRTYRMHVRVFLSRFRSYTTCRECDGSRLKPEALHFKVPLGASTGDGAWYTLPELWRIPVEKLRPLLESAQTPTGDKAAELLHGEIVSRLRYLERVGLGYLDLDRPTRSLSGGETERVNLTTCLGASLTNTLFVLDEPTVGLHPRDVGRLIGVMEDLRDRGNTLAVVEHEEAVIRAGDHLVDIGPGRGESGGQLVYAGPLDRPSTRDTESLTLDYLAGKREIPLPAKRRKPTPKRQIRIKGASAHNLRRLDLELPLDLLVCVTGVSGSGKSTLVHDVLYRNLMRQRGESLEEEPGPCRDLQGGDRVGEVVMVDQSPLSRTPRSTPAVYTGVFDGIRKLFAGSSDGQARGLTPGYFSFNSGDGRCERCWGTGYEKVEMQFLSDLFVTCPECEGRRYTPEALEIQLAGKNIHDILQTTVDEAIVYLINLSREPAEEGGDASAPRTTRLPKAQARLAERLAESLSVLAEVGLGYLRLGQPLNTLSGGESQRLKLVGHLLEKRDGTDTGALLIFDEPTTGLHFDDVAVLLRVFERLVEAGNTVLVIEHNLDVIKCADYLIDLGPEGGEGGGSLVAAGTPEEVAEARASHTGQYLRPHLGLDRKATKSSAVGRVAEPSPVPYANAKPARGKRTSANNGHAIEIHGAREHNLKNIDLEIPHDTFTVVTGLSGSGKSTLAFDILFAEGQRRFLDSMSTYARQFVEQMERPDIDRVAGLPPTVAIEQRISRGGGKSTVATVTEIWHFLRLLYAKVGILHSPETGKPLQKQSISAIATRLRKEAKNRPLPLLAPLVRARKGYHTEVAAWAERQGFETLFVDGQFLPSAGFQRLKRFREHNIDVVVAEITAETTPRRIREAVERALQIGKGTARYLDQTNHSQIVSTELCDPDTGRSFEELDPRLFSYNSPHGWCPSCRGYGTIAGGQEPTDDRHAESVLDAELREERRRSRPGDSTAMICPVCQGARLNEVALAVKVGGHTIDSVARLSVREASVQLDKLRFEGNEATITRDILPEIQQRLRFLDEVGLGYLQLDRSATTLSGGESQRIRLAAQLGSNLRGVLYILDEPTIGLHPSDNAALLGTLSALRANGNSLLVVEHDEETMRAADHLIDLGPGAGRFGGEVVFQGKPSQSGNKRSRQGSSPTLDVLDHPLKHPLRGERRPIPGPRAHSGWLRLSGARANNLRDLEVRFPLGRFTVITGISGSGKSSLMRGVLRPSIEATLAVKPSSGKAKNPKSSKSAKKKAPKKKAAIALPDTLDRLRGHEELIAVYEVDQSPIGKTSRSTPATYVKVFDEIRKLFAQTPEARARGYTASRFSFNTEGGRCETCKGNGQIKLEMNFLPTSYVECESCRGARYNPPTLEILYRGKSIGDVMAMTIEEAADFFEAHPAISRTLSLMRDTGLGYLGLGQPSPTLSGGEAQRIKLVAELTRGLGRSERARLRQRENAGRHLYLIEEPSIGLHPTDVEKLVAVLHRLADDGHTVVVIEHNLDIVAEADYLIDLGPGAGEEGGRLVAQGTPEEVAKAKDSRTAPYLRQVLER